MRTGWLTAVEFTLRLREFGLFFAGLPCCSFIWLNRSTSMRSEDLPFGDQLKRYIQEANVLLDNWISKSFFWTWPCIYIYILYFKVFHFSARSATIAVPTKDCYSHIAALRPLHSQICALGNRTASFFNFYTLSILEVDDSSAAELCGYQHPSLVGFSERMRICCVNYIYIYICTSVMMAIDGP